MSRRALPSNLAAVCDGASEASADQGLVTDSTTQNAPYFSTLLARLKRMRRNVLASGNLIHGRFQNWRGGFRHRVLFGTLTYRPGVEPSPTDMARLWDLYRKWCKRVGIDPVYLWVAELHKSGRVHYHFILWVPFGTRVPYFDQYRTVPTDRPPYLGIGPIRHVAWWPHGFANMKPSHSPVGYLAKYASKAVKQVGDDMHTYPRGLRIYGVGGLDAEQKQTRRYINWPAWLAGNRGPESNMKRISGGWIDRDTLDFWPSPWKLGSVATVGGRTFVSLVPALPEGCSLCFS